MFPSTALRGSSIFFRLLDLLKWPNTVPPQPSPTSKPQAARNADWLSTVQSVIQDSSRRRIVELGCGTGLCSLAASTVPKTVILATDYRQEPLELLQQVRVFLLWGYVRVCGNHRLPLASTSYQGFGAIMFWFLSYADFKDLCPSHVFFYSLQSMDSCWTTKRAGEPSIQSFYTSFRIETKPPATDPCFPILYLTPGCTLPHWCILTMTHK